MKKTLQIIFISVSIFMIAACSAPRQSITTSNNVTRGKFTGTWTITDISYDGILENAVQQVFDQARPEAFKGSTWKLTNSGNGLYTLNNGASQTIFWSVNNDDASIQQFQFKKLYQGDKAKNVDAGYRLVITNNDGNSMTLKSPVSIGTKTGYIIYTFTKAP